MRFNRSALAVAASAAATAAASVDADVGSAVTVGRWVGIFTPTLRIIATKLNRLKKPGEMPASEREFDFDFDRITR